MTPAAMQAAYARQIAKGESITLSRGTTTASVRAKVMGYMPEELVDDVQQGDRKLILLAADLVAGGFPTPRKNDKALVRSATLNVEAVDAETRSVAGVTIAYELRARG